MTAAVLRTDPRAAVVQVIGALEETTVLMSELELLRVVPGMLVELEVARWWRWHETHYGLGTLRRAWLDVAALGLTPLPRCAWGLEDLSRHNEIPATDPYFPLWAFFTSEPRMTVSLKLPAVEDAGGLEDEHPFSLRERVERLYEQSEPEAVRELAMQAVALDLRCITAHVVLGHDVFERSAERALLHYRVGVALGEFSLGQRFDGVLLDSEESNHPYLEALMGQGVCQWRLGQRQAAEDTFLLALTRNPPDFWGFRGLWGAVRDGLAWDAYEARGRSRFW